MRTRLLHGPLLLLLYQAVPVSAGPDSSGRYRLTVGVGGGRWENEEFSCNGELLSATRVPYSSGGAQLDAWATPRVRVSAFGGNFRPTPDAASDPVRDYSGAFGGGLVAYEGRKFGLGVGVTGISGFDGFTAPSGYLRIGTMAGGHVRADLFPPTPVLGSTGWFRGGVGFREVQRRVGGFVGVAVPPAYSEKAMITGSVHVPLARHVDVQFDAILGPGEQYSQQGASIALRYAFGAPSK